MYLPVGEGRPRCFGFVTFDDSVALPEDFAGLAHLIDGKQVVPHGRFPEMSFPKCGISKKANVLNPQIGSQLHT